MKTLILFLSFLFSSALAQAQEIRDWEPSLPITQEKLLQIVEQRAHERFYYEGKEKSCGGEIANPALADYFTFMGYGGELTHNVRLNLYVTGSYKGCQQITISECDLPMTIKNGKLVHIGNWHCTVIGVEE